MSEVASIVPVLISTFGVLEYRATYHYFNEVLECPLTFGATAKLQGLRNSDVLIGRSHRYLIRGLCYSESLLTYSANFLPPSFHVTHNSRRATVTDNPPVVSPSPFLRTSIQFVFCAGYKASRVSHSLSASAIAGQHGDRQYRRETRSPISVAFRGIAILEALAFGAHSVTGVRPRRPEVLLECYTSTSIA